MKARTKSVIILGASVAATSWMVYAQSSNSSTPPPAFTISPTVHCAVVSGNCYDSTMQVYAPGSVPSPAPTPPPNASPPPPAPSAPAYVCPATTFSYTAPSSAYQTPGLPSEHGHDRYNACGWNFTTPNGNVGDKYNMPDKRGQDVTGGCSLGYNLYVQNGPAFCSSNQSSGGDPYTAICNSDGTWHLYSSPPVGCYD